MDMPPPTPPPTQPEAGPQPQVGGEGPVYLSCAALILLVFLPWIHISFAGTNFSGMEAQMGELFSSMGVSATAAGYDTWAGRIALVAALACAALTWAERSGALTWNRGNALLVTAGCAGIAAAATLFAVFDFGRMSQISLYLALTAGGAALYFTVMRVREFGERRRSATAG